MIAEASTNGKPTTGKLLIPHIIHLPDGSWETLWPVAGEMMTTDEMADYNDTLLYGDPDDSIESDPESWGPEWDRDVWCTGPEGDDQADQAEKPSPLFDHDPGAPGLPLIPPELEPDDFDAPSEADEAWLA